MPTPNLTARVAPSIVSRVDPCVDIRVARSDEGADRSAVVRRSIVRALPMLEQELGVAARATKAKPPAKRTARRGAK